MVKYNEVGIGELKAYARIWYKPAFIFNFRISGTGTVEKPVIFQQVEIYDLDGLEELGAEILEFVKGERERREAKRLKELRKAGLPTGEPKAEEAKDASDEGSHRVAD